jgi:hypothetical protein
MNTTWSFFDPVTGAFAGRTYTGNDDYLAMNTPAGLSAIAGDYDHLACQVDLATLTVVTRAACPITSAVAARVVTLSGVPSGASFTIAGNASLTGTADSSGTLTLTFGAAGTYTVSIPCSPLLDYFGSFTLP